jgi:hypothetical protein
MKEMPFRWAHVVVGLVVVAAVVAIAHRGAANAPMGHYMLPGGGIVYDTKTQLTWQQVPVLQKDWANAQVYCSSNTAQLPGTGWRLPNPKELQTIVDESQGNPAIDQTAFPNTPTAALWTSSLVAGNMGSAWVVAFDTGGVYNDPLTDTPGVRCVR